MLTYQCAIDFYETDKKAFQKCIDGALAKLGDCDKPKSDALLQMDQEIDEFDY